MPSNLPSNEKKFQFQGFYRKGYPGGPERPFIRIIVALHRFGVSKQVDMMLDSGSDVTTLQPKDSLLMLNESQFKLLGRTAEIETMGGIRVKAHIEEGAVGFLLPAKRVCWVPTTFDITDPELRSILPSTLGNDVLRFGTTVLNAVRRIVKIEFFLSNPLITSI